MDSGILYNLLHQVKKMRYMIMITSIVISCVLFTIFNNNYISSNDIQRRLQTQPLSSSLNNTTINLLTTYHFSKNISQYQYQGTWNDLFFEKNLFQSLNGEATILFNPINRMLDSSNNESSLQMFILLKEQQYNDYIIKMNCTLAYPNQFVNDLSKSIDSVKPLSLVNKNTTLDIFYAKYFQNYDKETYEETDIDITFIPNIITIPKGLEMSSISFFGNVSINIRNRERHFNLDISSAQMYDSDYYSIEILNYSIILSIIGLIEIYYSTKLLIDVNTNNQVALNLDLMTVIYHIFYNSVIFSTHFFLSLSDNIYSREFGTPSIVYFFLFSVFQIRILFLTFKSRHDDLFHSDRLLFRKKLFQFYSFFYAGLFLCLISVRFWYQYFFLGYLVFFSTWIGQIIHSAVNGTKPPMTIKYIFVMTLTKLFLPVYLKAYPYNIFFFKPAYGKVFIIILTLFIEAIILSLQKIIGPKFFLPDFLKTQIYDYYKSIDQLEDTQIECVICLDKLDAQPIDSIDNKNMREANGSLIVNVDIEMNSKGKTLNEKIMDFILQFKPKRKNKEYMVTPCGHSFHTFCLEKWIEMKNECPYCRQKIPPLES